MAHAEMGRPALGRRQGRRRRKVRTPPIELARMLLNKRVNRGFHRLGLVLGVILTAAVLASASIANDGLYFQAMLTGAVLGLAFYGLMRSFGWIILGFVE